MRKNDNSESHLYTGFRFVSFLPSIITQRNIQVNIFLKNKYKMEKKYFLYVGTAFGCEINFFAKYGVLNLFNKTLAIDKIKEVKAAVLSQEQILPHINKFDFECIDIRNLPKNYNFHYWDFIQCGFVLEDIEYSEKKNVYKNLYKSLLPSGFLIISEMFLDNKIKSGNEESKRKGQIRTLYDQFLSEAEIQYKNNILNNQQYQLLIGNEETHGLLYTKRRAIDGLQDYFEDRVQVENQLKNIGFKILKYYQNPDNDFLGVILAQKPDKS